MDSFELNKIAGGVLGALTFVMLTSFAGELIFAEKKTAKAGYDLPMPAGSAVAASAPAVAAEPIAVRLASADKAKGENTFKQCATCHTPDKGGANKVGPNLWDIVGRKKASHAGFGYSSAMSAKGGDWSYEDIDHLVFKPTAYVRGTKMAFVGLAKEQERADVIAYLRTMAETPKPLP